ncbi:hypothetical protein AV947_gp41 [Podophage Lau218]|uniref:Putative phage protein n=2 Tax=Lauvirus lau218 TaxID=1465639 RepID=A0A060BK79_9CAUD|nr:hypothetical protein AV947_gp41 [Podophage Lau218]AIA83156.1 putative phage protein [Podophage Lau218]AIA83255.1 putative phage protein [Lauvirus lau218]
MKERVESLETQLALIKSEIISLKTREMKLPAWIRNASGAIIVSMFAQTVTIVWWASDLSSRHTIIEKQVDKNTGFIDAWPIMHEEVMVGLKEIQVENRNMKEMLHDIKKDIHK